MLRGGGPGGAATKKALAGRPGHRDRPHQHLDESPGRRRCLRYQKPSFVQQGPEVGTYGGQYAWPHQLRGTARHHRRLAGHLDDQGFHNVIDKQSRFELLGAQNTAWTTLHAEGDAELHHPLRHQDRHDLRAQRRHGLRRGGQLRGRRKSSSALSTGRATTSPWWPTRRSGCGAVDLHFGLVTFNTIADGILGEQNTRLNITVQDHHQADVATLLDTGFGISPFRRATAGGLRRCPLRRGTIHSPIPCWTCDIVRFSRRRWPGSISMRRRPGRTPRRAQWRLESSTSLNPHRRDLRRRAHHAARPAGFFRLRPKRRLAASPRSTRRSTHPRQSHGAPHTSSSAASRAGAGRIDWPRMRREAGELLTSLVSVDLGGAGRREPRASPWSLARRCLATRRPRRDGRAHPAAFNAAQARVLFYDDGLLKESGVGHHLHLPPHGGTSTSRPRAHRLRNGQLVTTILIAQTEDVELVALMLAQPRRLSGLTAFSETGARVVATASTWSTWTRRHMPDDVSLRVGKGEIGGPGRLLLRPHRAGRVLDLRRRPGATQGDDHRKMGGGGDRRRARAGAGWGLSQDPARPRGSSRPQRARHLARRASPFLHATGVLDTCGSAPWSTYDPPLHIKTPSPSTRCVPGRD